MSVVVLISGRGSNMVAMLDAGIPVSAVVSNRADAAGLQTAAARGIPHFVVPHREFPDREAFDAALADVVERCSPRLVVLAGFMRVLTAGFVNRFSGRLINIHPSLLPAFPGLATHERAIAAGVRFHGCTVHFVTADLDDGPIIAQAVVPVLDDDTPESLAERVLGEEHRIYPEAARAFLDGRLIVSGNRVLRTRA